MKHISFQEYEGRLNNHQDLTDIQYVLNAPYSRIISLIQNCKNLKKISLAEVSLQDKENAAKELQKVINSKVEICLSPDTFYNLAEIIPTTTLTKRFTVIISHDQLASFKPFSAYKVYELGSIILSDFNMNLPLKLPNATVPYSIKQIEIKNENETLVMQFRNIPEATFWPGTVTFSEYMDFLEDEADLSGIRHVLDVSRSYNVISFLIQQCKNMQSLTLANNPIYPNEPVISLMNCKKLLMMVIFVMTLRFVYLFKQDWICYGKNPQKKF